MIDVCRHCRNVTDCVTVGKFSLCKTHKDLRQYQPKERKIKPIKPRSTKRAKQEVEYSKVRKEYLAINPNCECCEKEFNIETPATELHHRAGRLGDLLIDKNNLLSVCRPCHLFIEGNPSFAKDNGYSEDRL